MDLIPIPATKPDSPAASPDALGGEPGFGDLIDSLLAGIAAANGGRPGADREDVDPDDSRGSGGAVPRGPLPGPGIRGRDEEDPAAGAQSLATPFERWDRPSPHVGSDLIRPASAPDVPATPAPSPLALAAADQPKEVVPAPPGPTREGGPAVPGPAARTDEAPKPVPVPVEAPGIQESGPAAPEVVASPPPEATWPSRETGHRPTTTPSTPPLPSDDPDSTVPDTLLVTRETRSPEADRETPPNRIHQDMGSPAGEAPEGQIARAITPSLGAERPGMAELVDQIREWADRVESAQRTDTISLKLADPDGELLVRLAMRDGRLEVNVSRPGGETPSWLLDRLDDALARRGFDMAGGGHRGGPEDGEAGDTLADGERPRQRTTKRNQDGLWM